MKKLVLFFFISFTSLAAYSQQSVYCEIVGAEKLLSSKVNVSIDFGQKSKFAGNQYLVDAEGHALEFNSMVDAMNFMAKFGWHFTQAYAVSSGNNHVYHWLLEKKVNDESEIGDGFMTKEQYKSIHSKEVKDKREKKANGDPLYF